MVCSFKRLIYPKSIAEAQSGGYTVAVYKLHERVVDGQGNKISEIKVVGHLLPVAEGLRYNIHGQWSKSAKHGPQYEMTTYEEVITPTREGIIAYLSSGLIKGIGPKTAERIFDMFGVDTLEILDSHPDELKKVPGISEAKYKKISSSYLSSRAARDIVTLLAPHGITPDRAVKIHKEYGSEAIDIVRKRPYQLCEIAGIGFHIADDIARKMGLDAKSEERIAAGLIQILRDEENMGNLCMPRSKLVTVCAELLNTNGLSNQKIAQVALQLLNDEKIVLYNEQVYRESTARAEQNVAAGIQNLLAFGRINEPLNMPLASLEKIIIEEQKDQGLRLDELQQQAIISCLSSHISIITGGPGTGKTLIQRVLLTLYHRYYSGAKIVCCAPTGRAARRMEESTGFPASTIHKALGLLASENGDWNEPETLDADFVLVDEVSMLDIYLARHLINSIPYGCQLVLVGDADQLPSVGPGAVLSELISCGKIPVVKLDKVFRQSAGSRVAMNAKLIRHNTVSLEYGADFKFVESSDLTESADILVRTYLQEIQKYGVDNVALLSPFRKKTDTGTVTLNKRLRDLVNPLDSEKREIAFGKQVFREGDKVMQIKNKENVNNGDIGYIKTIVYGDDPMVYVDFGDNRLVEYETGDLALLDLAYAQTVHKSQGSEYKSILVNIQMAHYPMLKRPLIYTAITRAKQAVTIVGERKALCMAIKKVDAEKRGTMLAHRINPEITACAG